MNTQHQDDNEKKPQRVNLDAIRAEVQKRQQAFNTKESTDALMARLRKQIDDVK